MHVQTINTCTNLRVQWIFSEGPLCMNYIFFIEEGTVLACRWCPYLTRYCNKFIWIANIGEYCKRQLLVNSIWNIIVFCNEICNSDGLVLLNFFVFCVALRFWFCCLIFFLLFFFPSCVLCAQRPFQCLWTVHSW